MKIAVDLDQVLGNFLPAVIKFHNKTYGTKLKMKDFISYNLWDVWGGNRDEAIQKVYKFFHSPYSDKITPMKGSQKAMKILKKKNQLYLITSRQDDFKKLTREWVNKHFPNIFTKIYFTNSYSKHGQERSKGAVCDKIGADVLIDDLPAFAIQCLKPGRKIFLYDCIWNKKAKLPKGIKRVNSWKDIIKNLK